MKLGRRFYELGVPIVALVLTLVLSGALWKVLARNQDALLLQRTSLALEVAERTIEGALRMRAEALARYGQRALIDDPAERERLFRGGARQFISDFAGLTGLGWQPLDGSAPLYYAETPELAERLALPVPKQLMHATIEPALAAGGEAVARFIVPVHDETGATRGFAITTFEYPSLIDDALVNLPGGFETAVRAHGAVVYRRPTASPPTHLSRYLVQREEPFYGAPLELSLWPSRRTATLFRSPFLDALPWLGLVLGTLFALTLRYSALARSRAGDAEQAVLKLRIEAEQREAVQRTLASAHEELRRRNEELQDFAFAASHDLQEPLRKIRAFGDRLRAKYGDNLGEQGSDYLLRMQGAASRMQALIEALLEYSRVSSQARPMKPVDLTVIAHEVVSDLETTIEASQGRVILGALPMVVADPVHMRQLLQNLIANGLKFRAPDRTPEVRVSAFPIVHDGKPWCRLVVADNGIGFDNQYAERIFAPFKRLHGRDEFEGTGIGLAIVRRIVERHHGVISAEGVSGRGATFTVDLPAGGEPGSAASLKMSSSAVS